MGHDVLFQAAAASKTFLAILTLVRFLFGMSLNMYFQVLPLCEGFLTDLTRVWSFFGLAQHELVSITLMSLLVLIQVTL